MAKDSKIQWTKARKQHECESCVNKIEPGEKYICDSLRIPRFDSDGKTQIGIEYIKFKMCVNCVVETQNAWKDGLTSDEIEKCESGFHFPMQEMTVEYAGCHRYAVPTGRTVCEMCGEDLTEPHSELNNKHTKIVIP